MVGCTQEECCPLQALDHNYAVLVSLFEDVASGQCTDITADDQAKMKKYLKIIKSTKFVFCLAFHADILDDLLQPCLIFQSNERSCSSSQKTKRLQNLARLTVVKNLRKDSNTSILKAARQLLLPRRLVIVL